MHQQLETFSKTAKTNLRLLFLDDKKAMCISVLHQAQIKKRRKKTQAIRFQLRKQTETNRFLSVVVLHATSYLKFKQSQESVSF